ncbi:MAG: hypothetical protein WAV16_02065 [Candidatus Moraniibacteriota bacterium]
MIENIPIEFTLGSFSAVGILGGYIWNDLNKEIEEIKKIQCNRPCHQIHLEITEIKTDVKWIKNNLKK